MYGYTCIFCTREEHSTLWHKSYYIYVHRRKFFILFFVFNFKFFITLLKYTLLHTHTPLGCLKKRTHTEILHTHAHLTFKRNIIIYICIPAFIHIISLAQYVHKHTHTQLDTSKTLLLLLLLL